MEHRAYPKIQATAPYTVIGGTWVLLEKVHGAGVVVGIDEDGVQVGKRKAWLEPNEVFFGWQRLRSELEAAGRQLRDRLGVTRLYLYGELCGEGVQTGIFYSHDLMVLWFDALVFDGRWSWVSYTELAATLPRQTVPLLARGTKASLEDYPVRFVTKVPQTPDPTAQWAEGYVKKPDCRHQEDSLWSVKRKIPEFDESDVFEGAVPFEQNADVPFEELCRWGLKMASHPARITSARSKVGDGAPLHDEVVLDVLADLESTWPRAIAAHLDPLADHLRTHVSSLQAHDPYSVIVPGLHWKPP